MLALATASLGRVPPTVFIKRLDPLASFSTHYKPSQTTASEENTLSNECTNIVMSCPTLALNFHHNCYIIITHTIVLVQEFYDFVLLCNLLCRFFKSLFL